MSQLILVTPGAQYLESYLAACREFKQARVGTYTLHDPDEFVYWRQTIFKEYESSRRGKLLLPGFVPSTTYWSILDGEFAGIGNVRHRLTPALKMHGGHIGYAVRVSLWGKGVGTAQLALLLKKAHDMGIDPALVTCNVENAASAAVIRKNGGQMVDVVPNVIAGKAIQTCRFWVPTGI